MVTGSEPKKGDRRSRKINEVSYRKTKKEKKRAVCFVGKSGRKAGKRWRGNSQSEGEKIQYRGCAGRGRKKKKKSPKAMVKDPKGKGGKID